MREAELLNARGHNPHHHPPVTDMSKQQTIPIARAMRNWNRGTAEVTLVWRCFYSKLGVEYREVTSDGGFKRNSIPDDCVKNWLWTFIRDQSRLQPDSYYVVDPPHSAWHEILTGLARAL